MQKRKPFFQPGKFLLLLVFCIFCDQGIAQINPPLTIPIVFHIISTNTSPITDQQIINAVQDLNYAFAHTGPYIAGAPGANTGITFCLARIDPDGGICSGITRTQSPLGIFDQDIDSNRLKSLVTWDTKQYCNIWLVDSIKNEYHTSFGCGVWTRKHDMPYAIFLPGGDYRDGIVTTGFGSLLATLMGTYLGLKVTYYGSCTNNDCNKDGDGICDTPPASGPGSSCNSVQNSCSSDTLSGFNQDMPDLVSNFMSMTGTCTNAFTNGQALRMRSILNGPRKSLIKQNMCNPPCTENITASFTRDNWLPVPGDIINFTSVSTGGANFEWSVNGIPAGTNNPNFSYSFNQKGKFKVQLKVYNSNTNCFASYSDSVFVGCGVLASFSPDKRIIAAKDLILNDTILFTNKSFNASAYQWWMSNDSGMAPQIISTVKDLNQAFHAPSKYAVWLVASDGTCTDTTEKFTFLVNDPTIDGVIGFQDVQCYQETEIKATFYICNSGYTPIPIGTPVTFYDGDPNSDTSKKLGAVFLTTVPIAGNCCYAFTTILDIGRPGLNKLYAVFNDSGNTKPLLLPNTLLPEKNYKNNISLTQDFQFRIVASPPTATLLPGDTLQLSANAGPGVVTSYIWSSAPELSCTYCQNPVFIAGIKDVSEKIYAISKYGCSDSTSLLIKVPPADDYIITIGKTECANNDSVHIEFSICNQFERGYIPDGLNVTFYGGNPSSGSAKLLLPVYKAKTSNNENCMTFNDIISGPGDGLIYGVVNDKNNSTLSDSVFSEKDYSNNISAGFSVTPFIVSIFPSDTSVYRQQPVTMQFLTTGGQATSFSWNPSEFISCPHCASTIVIPPYNLQIGIEVQNEYGCTTKGFAYINTFTNGKVSIPNAFSPDGNGHNDIFYIMGSREVKIIKEFNVFNRWGQAVLAEKNVPANDPKYGWNGLINGKPANAGAYAYIVLIEFSDGTTQIYKGTVILIN